MALLKKSKVDIQVDGLDEIRTLVEQLEKTAAKLEVSSAKALEAAKELSKAVDKAEAQRRRPISTTRHSAW